MPEVSDDLPDLRTGRTPHPVQLTKRCPAKTDNHTCYLIDHPGFPVHVDLSEGWLGVWSLVDSQWTNEAATPQDPLTDAPEQLK